MTAVLSGRLMVFRAYRSLTMSERPNMLHAQSPTV